MRVVRLISSVIGVIVGGCNFPHGGLAQNGSDGGDGPAVVADARVDSMSSHDGATDAASDAGGDASSFIDSDGDTIPDASDNCPTNANADQRDHDADGRGDVCDLCPHLASATDPDGDSDGVGDDCDPRPTLAGDHRVLWEGFYDAASITGWVADGNATWLVMNGALVESSSTNDLSSIGPPLLVPRAAVTSTAHVLQIGAASFTASPQVSVASAVGARQYESCAVTSVMNQGNRIVASSTWRDTFNVPRLSVDTAAWNGAFVAGAELRLTEAVSSASNHCAAVQGAVHASVSTMAGPSGGRVVVSTTLVSASFDYLFVVQVGP